MRAVPSAPHEPDPPPSPGAGGWAKAMLPVAVPVRPPTTSAGLLSSDHQATSAGSNVEKSVAGLLSKAAAGPLPVTLFARDGVTVSAGVVTGHAPVLPASRAGLPAISGCVGSGAPHVPSGASLASPPMKLLGVLARYVPARSGPVTLPETMVLPSVRVPPVRVMPAPAVLLREAFLLIVQDVRPAVPPLTKSPPPLSAVLPDKVDCVISSRPALAMAPPDEPAAAVLVWSVLLSTSVSDPAPP